MRIYYLPAQSKNQGQSKNICVIIIIIIIIIIIFCEHYDLCMSINWMSD